MDLGSVDWPALITIILATLFGVGGIKGADALTAYRQRQAANPAAPPGAPVPVSIVGAGGLNGLPSAPRGDATGEIRTITVEECRANHGAVGESLEKIAERHEETTKSLHEIETSLARLHGDLGEKFARLEIKVGDTVRDEVSKHERAHHRAASGK